MSCYIEHGAIQKEEEEEEKNETEKPHNDIHIHRLFVCKYTQK